MVKIEEGLKRGGAEIGEGADEIVVRIGRLLAKDREVKRERFGGAKKAEDGDQIRFEVDGISGVGFGGEAKKSGERFGGAVENGVEKTVVHTNPAARRREQHVVNRSFVNAGQVSRLP